VLLRGFWATHLSRVAVLHGHAVLAQAARELGHGARRVDVRVRGAEVRAHHHLFLTATQRALSITPRTLSVTERALSVTQRSLSVTQRFTKHTHAAVVDDGVVVERVEDGGVDVRGVTRHQQIAPATKYGVVCMKRQFVRIGRFRTLRVWHGATEESP
jgi:hypothetical protein